MSHHCHWSGCPIEVPPKMWGCPKHWFALPKHFRDRIWRAYRPGQEIDKKPSDEYITVAMEVRQWIKSQTSKPIGLGTIYPKPEGRFDLNDVAHLPIEDWPDEALAELYRQQQERSQ